MSHSLLRRLLIVSLIPALVSIAVGQSNRGYVRLKRIGPVVKVEDNVTKELTREFAAQPAEEVRILENNTVITTGTGSSVILVFSNGATLNVKEESTVNIITFRQDPFAGSYDPSTASNEPDAKSRTEIFLQQGELVGNVKKLRPDSVFNVATPAGAAGIRGTTFRVVFRPTGTGQAFFSVTTLEGDVGVTTVDGTIDAPIGVLDDQEITIIVDVDDTTGAVTVVTPLAEIVTVAADTQVLGAMAEAVQQSVEAVVNIAITSDADQAPAGGDEAAGETPEGQEETDEQPKEEETPAQEQPAETNEEPADTAPPPPAEPSEDSVDAAPPPPAAPPTPPVVDDTDNPSPTAGRG